MAIGQQKAYGRRGRAWAAPRGGLWFSLILRPSIRPGDAAFLPSAVALCVGEALEKFAGPAWGFRWPNDIVVSARKIAGVLGESKIVQENVEHVVLGVGLNANFAIRELPEDLRESSTTLLHETKRKVDLAYLLVDILARLESKMRFVAAGEHERLLSPLRAHDALLGRVMRLRTHLGVLRATGKALTSDGKLMVELADGSERVFDSGEVERVELL